jgi:plasmid stabilization system protein ParE
MEYKIIWSDAAIEDLNGICSYIARDNPEAAERIGNGILDHVLILGDFPSSGRRIREEQRDHCVKSFSARTGFSTMCPKKPAVSKSFMSAMELETSQIFNISRVTRFRRFSLSPPAVPTGRFRP